MEIIDVHCHIVPDQLPPLPEGSEEASWPCICHKSHDRASVEIAGKTFRQIDYRSWDPGRRIDDMGQMGISRQVLSPMPELLSYWFSPSDGLSMCRWLNERIAHITATHPERFSGLGMVPLQDPELAAKELPDVAAAGLSGVEIGSNINGKLLGEPEFHEFYAEAERLNLCLFIHALHPIGADRLKSQPDLVPFAAFPLDTALTAVSLIRAGVPEKFPNLRFGFSHGGGAVIPLVHRLGKGALLTNNFDGQLTRPPADYAANFYYDSLVYDENYLAYLANVFAPGQVFCGTDYPYLIMENDPDGFTSRANLNNPASVRSHAALKFLGLT